jgi:hypothetical protein
MADSTADRDGAATGRDIYSVSRLNLEARLLLEQGFARIWLEGELSNVSRPSSGHLYFSLKDARAQIRAAMFRSRNQAIRFRPEEGLQVLVRGQVSLYEPRGDYQLIVDHMEEAGDGALRRAFEELKRKLDAEGLFDAARKQPLPALPGRIGVITSPSGAAVRDVISVLRRRFPAIPVLIYPVPVQGKEAGSIRTRQRARRHSNPSSAPSRVTGSSRAPATPARTVSRLSCRATRPPGSGRICVRPASFPPVSVPAIRCGSRPA